MKTLLATLILTAALFASGQYAPAKPGGISRVMTPADRTRTGIDKLTTAEQENLQDWIIRTADAYVHSAAKSPAAKAAATKPRTKPTVQYSFPPPQPRIRKAVRLWAHGAPMPSHGHYITEKIRDRNPRIRLEDDSIWEVSPVESYTMFMWLPAEEISLVQGDDPNYPVTMVNTHHGRSVNVRLLSQ
jgi:hypothetical protein